VSFGLVLQALIVGLAAGAVYGLVAVGFSLVYRLTSVLQFAHGDLVGLASFLLIAIAFGSGPPVATGVPLWRYLIGVLVVLVASAAIGVAVYLVAVRPFLSSAIGWIGTTVAIAFAIEGSLVVLFPRESYVLPDPLPFGRWGSIGLTGGASIPPRALYVLGVGVVVAMGARIVLRRGWFGIAVAAVADQPEAARLVGLPIERLLGTAFAVAGLLAGIAGLIGVPEGGAIGVQTGALFGLKAIAAALIGGLVDMERVYVTALGLGIFESCIATLVPHGGGVGWRDVAPLLVAVVVLAARPPRAAVESLG
jgi:branched-chain amino acid transport system permease protein